MSTPLQTAAACFNENVELFAPVPGAQPEKFNLYNGLFNLAQGAEELNQQIGSIRAEIQALRLEIQQIRALIASQSR